MRWKVEARLDLRHSALARQGMRQVTTGLGSLFNDAGDDDDGNDPLVFVKPKDPSTQAAKPAAKVRYVN